MSLVVDYRAIRCLPHRSGDRITDQKLARSIPVCVDDEGLVVLPMSCAHQTQISRNFFAEGRIEQSNRAQLRKLKAPRFTVLTDNSQPIAFRLVITYCLISFLDPDDLAGVCRLPFAHLDIGAF